MMKSVRPCESTRRGIALPEGIRKLMFISKCVGGVARTSSSQDMLSEPLQLIALFSSWMEEMGRANGQDLSQNNPQFEHRIPPLKRCREGTRSPQGPGSLGFRVYGLGFSTLGHLHIRIWEANRPAVMGDGVGRAAGAWHRRSHEGFRV